SLSQKETASNRLASKRATSRRHSGSPRRICTGYCDRIPSSWASRTRGTRLAQEVPQMASRGNAPRTDRLRIVESQQSAQIEITVQRARDLIDPDAPRRRVEHEGGGHAARQGVQQELHRIRALVVAQEHRRFPVDELERSGA